MKTIFGALAVAAALVVAGSGSATPVQAKPALTKAVDSTQTADRAVTDISARRYYRRYGYGYRPRYYRPYGYGYGYGYRPYGYYGGYRRPGIYLGF